MFILGVAVGTLAILFNRKKTGLLEIVSVSLFYHTPYRNEVLYNIIL